MFMYLFSNRYPLHASCKIDWEFSASCEDVQAKILSQIDAWDVSRKLTRYPIFHQSQAQNIL